MGSSTTVLRRDFSADTCGTELRPPLLPSAWQAAIGSLDFHSRDAFDNSAFFDEQLELAWLIAVCQIAVKSGREIDAPGGDPIPLSPKSQFLTGIKTSSSHFDLVECQTTANSTFSIREASSSLARELFTRFDAGHFCSNSFGAGLSNSTPAVPLSHGSKSFSASKPACGRAPRRQSRWDHR